MQKFVLVYRGGQMAATDEERQQQMAAWTAWFASLGEAVVEGGHPFGESRNITASGSGSVASPLGGYSVFQAASLDAVSELAKGCPVLEAADGAVEVYQAIEM